MTIEQANAAVIAAQKKYPTSEGDVSFQGDVKTFLISASCNVGSRHPKLQQALDDLVAAVKAGQ